MTWHPGATVVAGAISIGLVLLAVSWMCWTGRWRAWSRLATLPAFPIALAPGLGLCFVLAGIGELLPSGPRGVLFALALLSAAAGIVIGVWDPDWYGPRWYRERDRSFDVSVPLNAAIAATAPMELGGAASGAVARAAMGGGEPLARWRAHLVSDVHGRPSAMQRIGIVRGHLLLYPDALVFAADAREDGMRGRSVVEVLPAGSIVAALRVAAGTGPDGAQRRPARDLPSMAMPRLRVETVDGVHVFETMRASRRAREIEERYLRAPGPKPPV
jgi:hypothetical protein